MVDPGKDLVWEFSVTDGTVLEGYVFDPSAPERRWVVEVVVNGFTIAVAPAHRFSEELYRERRGDGCYGVWIRLPSSDQITEVEVRLANSARSLGLFRVPAPTDAPSLTAGEVRWNGGVRLSGWLAPGQAPGWLRFAIDDEIVLECPPNRWSHVDRLSEYQAVAGFDVHLSRDLADGSPKVVRVFSQDGRELDGSPLSLIAWEDDLHDLPSQSKNVGALRAEALARLVPQSVPFGEYAVWSSRFLRFEPPNETTVAVVLVGDDEDAVARTLQSLSQQTLPHWVGAALPSSDRWRFRPTELSGFLASDGADCDVAVLMRAGTQLEPFALGRLVEALQAHPRAVLSYGDVTMARDGHLLPIGFPAFDYERLLEQGYFAPLFAMRSDALKSALNEGRDSLFALALSPFDEPQLPRDERVAHAPGPLALVDWTGNGAVLADAVMGHLARRGLDGFVTSGEVGCLPTAHVRRSTAAGPVTLIIPTRNRADLLGACVDSLAPVLARGEAKLLIIDNDSQAPDALQYLHRLEQEGAKVIRVPGEFNYSRLNNRAVDHVETELICLLNNDVEALDGDWLAEMTSRIADPRVGVVGALLMWPSRVIQHGGIVLGERFDAGHAHVGLMLGDPGYGDLLRVAHQCSAVTGACLLTRTSLYREVGGLDERRFSVNYNDVDYCLRVAERGLRTVMTPRAVLLHRESSSRGRDVGRDKEARLRRELAALRLSWYEQLANDKAYSPILGLDPDPYTALAWPPRTLASRVWDARKDT